MTTFLCGSVFEDVNLSGIGTAVLCIILAVMVLAAVAVNVIPRLVHKWEAEYTTRDLTYGAACLALAYALSWAGVKLPQGGTITIAALAPVFIYCYYFGFRKGMVIISAYTLLQLLQFPYIVSPWSAFFDYILPYFSLCVVGLFRYKPQKYAAFVKKNGKNSAIAKWGYTVAGHWGIFVGAVLHMLIRYVSQTFSGMLFFADAEVSFGANLTYCLTYNTFGIIDSAVAIAATFILLSSRSFYMFMTVNFDDKKALRDASMSVQAFETADASVLEGGSTAGSDITVSATEGKDVTD